MRAAIRISVVPLVVLLALGAVVRRPAAAPAAPAATAAAPLSWLAGCWEQRSATRVVEEHWLPPAGGALLGLGRTLRTGAAGETMVEFEYMRIVAHDGGWVFIAQPSGRPPTEFASASAGDREIVFANPHHDFPQQVTYRAVGSDSLFARVEGPSEGGVHGIDFRYARAACVGGGAAR